MPMEFINPPNVHDTAGRYHHAALITGPARRLVLSGQVGTAPDGTILEGVEAQARQIMANIRAILESQGMGLANVAKITAFLTDPSQIPAWRAARTEAFGGAATASTLLIVAGLADPRFLLEVEAEAVG
ncbi:RidA family protein [Roseomonas sp. CCTCC AB2023176]|uniref:RidA family protein n=1 Tax=Roseomonas sp. CCTCC AB2023176 TaxID=3342640 RepID=UPI0035DF9D3C